MRYRGIIAFVILLITLSNSIHSQEKTFQYFTVGEGLSYNTVYAIAQDNEGFIWIGTGEGLNRYDSYGFKTYYADNSENSLPSNEIQSLLVTQKGTIFIGTSNGICKFDPLTKKFTRLYYNGQSLGMVRCIIQSKNGKIYSSGVEGVYVLNENGEIESNLTVVKK